jgi:glucose/arabinose dehydrogenase
MPLDRPRFGILLLGIMAGALATERLVPAPIRIRIEDLPAPSPEESVDHPPRVVPMPEDAALSVPDGFTVQIFAEHLASPRWLAITPEGDALVTETRRNRILRLVDADHDGVAERRETFASGGNGVDIPFGMAFATIGEKRYFYLGNSDEVRRYEYRRRLRGEGERIAALPGGGYHQHWTRNVLVDRGGDRLFVSVGSQSNDDPEPPPRASILTMGLDGSNPRTFASGLRNPVGLALEPRTGALFATVNERDGLGDDLVPDYLARIVDGAFYGWPYAYLDPSHLDPRHAPNGRSPRPELVARTRTPEVLFQAHSAALGLAFYREGPFPARYHGGAFVAFRGSWNRDRGTGYALVFVPFDAHGAPLGTYEAFVTGFLLDPSVPTTWGRPVGIAILPDGSLLFTEEANGRVFRVAYAAHD